MSAFSELLDAGHLVEVAGTAHTLGTEACPESGQEYVHFKNLIVEARSFTAS